MAQRIGPQPSFLNDLFSRIGSGLNTYGAQQQQQREAEALQQEKELRDQYLQQMNIDPNLPPDLQKLQLQERKEQRGALQKALLKNQTDRPGFMELIKKRENLAYNPQVKQLAQQLGVDLTPYTPMGNVLQSGNLSEEIIQKLGGNQPLSNREETQLREQMVENQPSNGLIDSLQRLPAILGSGLSQSLGSGLGINNILNALMAPESKVPGTSKEDISKEIERVQNELQNAPEDSFQRRGQEQYLKRLQQQQETIQKRGSLRLPNQEDVLREYIQPMTTMDLTPSGFFEKVADIGSKVAPSILADVMTGGATKGATAGNTIWNIAKRTFGPATAGELTKKITGSDLAGDTVTMLGYLFTGMQPRAAQTAAEKGFNTFEQAVQKAPRSTVRITDKIGNNFQKTSERLSAAVEGSPGYNLLRNALKKVDQNIPTSGKLPIGEVTELHKELGRVFPSLAKAGFKKEAAQLRNFTKGLIQSWGKTNAPKALKQWDDANSIWSTLANTRLLNERLNEGVKSSGMALSWQSLLKRLVLGAGAGPIKKGLKHADAMASNPKILKIVARALRSAAEDNPTRTTVLMERLQKTLEKDPRFKDMTG